MARGWKTVARKAAPAASFWLLIGLLAYLGISAAVKIEATETRLFFVVVVFVVAFAVASLAEHLLRDYVLTEIQATEIWPRWHSQFSEPMVYRQSVSYSYLVLPRPS